MAEWRDVARAYDRGAATYDERHDDTPASRARTRVIDGALLEAINGATSVLEIGVGTGRLLAQVHAPVRIGVDIAAGMLARATEKGLRVVLGDGHELPFADGAFDAVIAGKGSMRYLTPARALAEARRVVRPGGTIGCHLYGGRTWSPRRLAVMPQPGLWQPASTAELRETLAAAGLTGAVRVFRPIRIRPYLLEIPAWLDRRAPVQLWSHAVVVARRP